MKSFVRIIIRRADARFLVLREPGRPFWNFPGGKVEKAVAQLLPTRVVLCVVSRLVVSRDFFAPRYRSVTEPFHFVFWFRLVTRGLP